MSTATARLWARIVAAAALASLAALPVAPASPAGASWRGAGLQGVTVYQLEADRTSPGVLYASGSGSGARTHLVKSVDAGKTWLPLERGLPAGFDATALAVSPDEGRLVIAGGVEGAYRSTAAGAIWQRISSPLPALTTLHFDRDNPLVVLAGSEVRGNFRSTDGGITWRPAIQGLPRGKYGMVPGAVAFAQSAIDPRRLMMGAYGFDGVYGSADGGLTWAAAGGGLPSKLVLALAFGTGQPEPLYVLTERALARSTDYGGTWQSLPGFPLTDAVALLVDPEQQHTLYVASARGAVFRSTNGGGSWVELTQLPRPVRALESWSGPGNRILAAAAGEGVWQLPLQPTLPASPEPAARNRQYFPETGHNLSPTFYSYFQARGGTERFGLPRTEEFVEDGVLVQYFQRARLEYHPEHRGTAYEVQISLLGEQLLGPDGPPPVEPFESSADQRYFPETGHSVSFAFLRYFTNRGGLDSLGYPISEEMQENGRPVQYFQRARLEYRADLAGTRDEVQLGLVGDEVLRKRGWLS